MKSPFLINEIPITIPTEWCEITLKQFLALQKSKTDNEILSVVTGIDLETCNNVPTETCLIILQPLLELVGEPMPEIEATEICSKKIPVEIGKLEFARKINCDVAGKTLKDFELVSRIVSVYCAAGIEDEDIDTFEKSVQEEKLIHVLSAGKNIGEQLQTLAKSEAKIKAGEYESEEFQAGINDFKKYGVWGLARGIALRWSISIEDVYKWSYNKVLLELKYSSDENSYQRKLNKILSRKK